MAKPSTYTPLKTLTTICTSTTSGSIALPTSCSAFLISSETIDPIVTLDGSTPSLGTTSTSSVGHFIPHGQAPFLILVGGNSPASTGSVTIKAIASSAGTAKIQITTLQ